MPLKPGSNKEATSENIGERETKGHPHDQDIAAALEDPDLTDHADRQTGHAVVGNIADIGMTTLPLPRK